MLISESFFFLLYFLQRDRPQHNNIISYSLLKGFQMGANLFTLQLVFQF